MKHVQSIYLANLLLFAQSTRAQLPYNPTRVLLPPNDADVAYIFRPAQGSNIQQELASLDISKPINSAETPWQTLYTELPFLSHESTAFTPVIKNGGDILVYAGDCAGVEDTSYVWKYSVDNGSEIGNGTWSHRPKSLDGDIDNLSLAGANFLASGVWFSSEKEEDDQNGAAFIFGGMCPTKGADLADWTSSANYSNFMLTIEPQTAAQPASNYEVGLTASRGPPIAEAGFSITPLSTTFSNSSEGKVAVQQNFVFLGGHTQTAFINMSQLALFSLPQESWTFLPVQQPANGRSDLTVRDPVEEVEPRSGHTAVLTPGGDKIVVFGGWVGDVGNPADPQLAILEVGAGFGGSGAWQWTVPDVTGSELLSAPGVYGHGAAMLPGGVMMVTGGFPITATSQTIKQRQVQGAATLFFNTTSNTWSSTYVPPPKQEANQGQGSPGPLSTTSQKAGLGVGVSVAGAIVLGLVVFYALYTRRLKNQRESREKELKDLAMGAYGGGGGLGIRNIYDSGSGRYPQMMEQHSRHRDWNEKEPEYDLDLEAMDAYEAEPQSGRRQSAREAQRTGLYVEIPSPTRGLRKSLGTRGNYVLAPHFDEKRMSREIHPIEEEDEQLASKAALKASANLAADVRGTGSYQYSPIETQYDPFAEQTMLPPNPLRANPMDPPIRPPYDAAPHPPEPSTATERHEEIQQWASDWAAAEEEMLFGSVNRPAGPLARNNGRVSPDKSDRTSSSLSERSTRSNLTARSSNAPSRTLSLRSQTLLSALNPFATPDHSPTHEHPPAGLQSAPADPEADSSSGRRVSRHSRIRSLTNTSVYKSRTSDDIDRSSPTRHTTIAQLQAEGEILLGGSPYAAAASSEPRPSTSTSASRLGLGTSWFSSMRRALPPIFPLTARSLSMTTKTPSFPTTSAGPNPSPAYTDNPSPNSTTDNPTSKLATNLPRRAISEGGFWRNKRGKRDWDTSDLEDVFAKRAHRRRRGEHSPYRDDPDAAEVLSVREGDDWGAPEDAHRRAVAEARKGKGKERAVPLPERAGVERSSGGKVAEEEEDWDVEAAAERRVVQVMFTVPKTRLRVVNADVDVGSLISTEDEEGRRVVSGMTERSEMSVETVKG